MRQALVLIAALVAAALTSAPARAQWSYDDDDRHGYDDVIRCESRDGRTERCWTDARDVDLVRQLSSTPCIRGRNWGTDSRGVWVSGGCRAEFRASWGGYDNHHGYGDTIRCESRNGDLRYCDTRGARAELVRQLSSSPCIRGRSWGSDSRGVWVSEGCRAEFRLDRYGNGHGYGNHGVVRCESRDNRTRECPMGLGRRGDVRLVRQLSSTPCIENQTWGRSRNGVWVTRGCRAEFVATRHNRPGGAWFEPGDLGSQPGQTSPPGVFADGTGSMPGSMSSGSTPRPTPRPTPRATPLAQQEEEQPEQRRSPVPEPGHP